MQTQVKFQTLGGFRLNMFMMLVCCVELIGMVVNVRLLSEI